MFARSLCFFVLFIGGTAVRGAVLLSDNFSYSDGPLQVVSSERWAGHSGTANQVSIENGRVKLSGSQTQDVNSLLEGQPYTRDPDSNPVLFASWTVKFSALPSKTGSYFAHFKDNRGGFRARVWALPGAGTPGTFRLGISSSSGTAPANIHEFELELDTVYRVVIQLEVNTSVSRLWINPSTEADPNVESPSGSALSIAAFALRQASGIGDLEFDDLLVGTTFGDVMPLPNPDSNVEQAPKPAPEDPTEPSPAPEPDPPATLPGTDAEPAGPSEPPGAGDPTPADSPDPQPVDPQPVDPQPIEPDAPAPEPVTGQPPETDPPAGNDPLPDPEPSPAAAPAITTASSPITAAVGETVLLNIEVAGAEPLTFRWSFNGSEIPGATKPSLELARVTPEHQGEYRVFVENPFGTATSSAIELIVSIPPVSRAIRLGLTLSPSGDPVLRWKAEPYRSYSIFYSEHPGGPFWPLASGLLFTDEHGLFTDNQLGRGAMRFYQISAP